jgi:hypothetical protein
VQARVLRELERRGLLRDPNDARDEVEEEPMIGCAQPSSEPIGASSDRAHTTDPS